MQITSLQVRNFKSIRDIRLENIDSALILVGKNNTGKTSILDAIRMLTGAKEPEEDDFNEKKQRIEIEMTLHISQEDLLMLHEEGRVSRYRRYEYWYADFCRKLPSFVRDQKEEFCSAAGQPGTSAAGPEPSEEDGGDLTFIYTRNASGQERYSDKSTKNNKYIREVLPQIYYIGTDRNLEELQRGLLSFAENEELERMRSDVCLFEESKRCSRCFQCIGLLNQKNPSELSACETAKLLEYKLCSMNLKDFSEKLNRNFRLNGGYDEIRYQTRFHVGELCTVEAEAYNQKRRAAVPVGRMGEGMRSIYMLSLLETYIQEENRLPCVILVKDPETFLHPQLQKKAGEILYRLSQKNQVIFSTHSPDTIFNFRSDQICQVVLDEECSTAVRRKTKMDEILNDLGFNAGDLMNVSFVFIVEGKQDRSRLPLLLQKYYSEVYDENGKLSRIAILSTNSCTNIRTYANLKYMNQIYLRDQFLMIRDGDGKDPEKLAADLCRYYDARDREDPGQLPRVRREHVLILKYYSFENYFLNPKIMVQIGILKKESDFYRILLEKWKEYLCRIRSGRHLTEVLGFEIRTAGELKAHMEEFKIYMRGHNLFDIFYGPHRRREEELLRQYIELEPREEFADILDAIDRFAYFDSRKRLLSPTLP